MMRVLMFGRGVISTIYGHALQAAGHDIEFYVRPGRAAEYGDEVRMDLIDARRSRRDGRVRHTFPIRVRESVAVGDGFDLIVLSVGHHLLAAAAAFLAPRIGDATVLVFGNVWDEPLAAVAPLPPDQVVFGFPQAGGGFDDDGILQAALFRSVIVAKASEADEPRGLVVRAAFQHAGFTIREKKDIQGWLWLHFIADACMHAQGRRYGGLAGLIGNRAGLRDALLIIRELLPVLQSRGVDLRKHRSTVLPYRIPALAAAAMAWTTARLPIAQVSLAAHTDPNAAESLAVLRDALHGAHLAGIPTPLLRASFGDVAEVNTQQSSASGHR